MIPRFLSKIACPQSRVHPFHKRTSSAYKFLRNSCEIPIKFNEFPTPLDLQDCLITTVTMEKVFQENSIQYDSYFTITRP